MVIENWFPIKGYEGVYEISDTLKIKSLGRYRTYRGFKYYHKERLLKPANTGKYLMVSLSKNGTFKNHLLHRLIAIAFIPNPDNKPCINHKNGIKTDNRVENLEWCTYSENNSHGFRVLNRIHNKPSKGRYNELHWNSKPIKQYNLSGELVRIFPSVMEAKRNGFHKTRMLMSCKGQIPSYRGFIWSY